MTNEQFNMLMDQIKLLRMDLQNINTNVMTLISLTRDKKPNTDKGGKI